MAAEKEVKRSPVRSVVGTALQTSSPAKVPAIGRPSAYTRKIADAILDRLAAGELLKDICLRKGIPPEKTIRGWIVDDRDGFFARYERAHFAGMNRMEDDIRVIADDSSGDMTLEKDGRVVANHENINRSRLRVDTRKWIMSKRYPKTWGDRLEQQITGSIDVTPSKPDLSNLSTDELKAFETLMMKAALPR